MTEADRRTATHLSRLGINPVVVQRLAGWAHEDGITLKEQVRFILNDYAPPLPRQGEDE